MPELTTDRVDHLQRIASRINAGAGAGYSVQMIRDLAQAVSDLLAERAKHTAQRAQLQQERDDATAAAAHMAAMMREAHSDAQRYAQDGRIDEHVYSELAASLEDQASDTYGEAYDAKLQHLRSLATLATGADACRCVDAPEQECPKHGDVTCFAAGLAIAQARIAELEAAAAGAAS